MASASRIFVGIASYRDTECQWTVRDLFAKAAKPERISVGICWQVIPGEDDDCFQFETRPEQVRAVRFHANESKGAGWARHQVYQLWQGEDFFLQIDSHMRFAENWDAGLIAMLERCPAAKPVLSTYPIAYVPPDKLDPPSITVLRADRFNDEGILVNGSYTQSMDTAAERPTYGGLIGAGYVFGPGSIIQEVPYDPYIYFHGEESSMAARLWTHGYDLFVPNKPFIWHDYSKDRGRSRHWSDNRDWPRMNDLSVARVKHLLGTETAKDPEALKEIEKYGLGTARSLADFEGHIGVDFSAKTISICAGQGRFPPPPPAEPGRKQNLKSFTAIYKSNGWGGLETRSGSGSTMAATTALRRQLPQVFSLLGIRSLIDAGCGDFNWLSRVDAGLESYLGLDIVEEMIASNRALYGERLKRQFAAADIVFDPLPKADLILCRDCLTHLPNEQIKKALANFKRSGARYLLTTHFETAKNQDIEIGQWRPIDLKAAPFGLPSPRLAIDEAPAEVKKRLALWLLSEIP
jgi:hypothetical protein